MQASLIEEAGLVSKETVVLRRWGVETNVWFINSRKHQKSKTSKDLEAVMNSELQKVINYCNLNKLSINMKKTNFMIITSPQKPTIHNINILNIDRKTCIKY